MLTKRHGQGLANRLCEALELEVPGSFCRLRGSLASGAADQFSDIDLAWEIPGSIFIPTLCAIEGILNKILPIASFRSDPDFHDSTSERLFFIRFSEMPIFARVDLQCIAGTPIPDSQLNDITAIPSPWSNSESVLMNCVAAIKYIHRGRISQARELMERACARLNLSSLKKATVEHLIEEICNQIALTDLEKRDFALEISRAASELSLNEATSP